MNQIIYTVGIVCFIFASCVSSSNVSSSSISYTNLPQGSYDEITVDISVAGLSQLFTMTKIFVDIVFQPFSYIESFVFQRVMEASTNQGDFIQSILKNWQTLASFEVGFMACVVAGCLFIVFVPIVALIMCCCRTCCNNCGGEMIQTSRRVKSGWRHCLCVALLIITVLITIPCVFVFLTNEWTTQVIKVVPEKVDRSFTDATTYIDSISNQLDHLVNQYGKLDDRLRKNVTELGTNLGVPIRDSFRELSNSSLEQVKELSNDLQKAMSALLDVQRATNLLNQSATGLTNELAAEKTSLDDTLNISECNSEPQCKNLQSTTSILSLGGNFSSFASVQNVIDDFNRTLESHDINQIVGMVNQHINDIPQMVSNASSDIVNEILNALNQVNQTLIGQLSKLPVEDIKEFNRNIADVNRTVVDAALVYSNLYDQYRYIAGIVLGAIIAVICAFYYLGMLLGSCEFDSDLSPNERSASSNCGGLLIMTAVGFSFIFAWVLMILVTLTFTVGGHGERYLCQSMQSPYEGLKFADKILNTTGFNIANRLGYSDPDVTIHSIFVACENNQSIYEALQLQHVYNITELLGDSKKQLAGFQEKLNNFTIDLSTIKIFTPNVQDALNKLRTANVLSIDSTTYIDEIQKVVSADTLTIYAQNLNQSADALNATTPSHSLYMLADSLRRHSANIINIQDRYRVLLNNGVTQLSNSILALEDITTGLNQSIENISIAVQKLDTDIQTNGNAYIKNKTVPFSNSLIKEVNTFADWFILQIEDHFGACRPLFLVYSQVVSLLCDYFMDTLNGLWFSLGWCVFFLIPGAIVGMKLAKFYRRVNEADDYTDTLWNDMEMAAFNSSNNNGHTDSTSSAKYRSRRVLPNQYY